MHSCSVLFPSLSLEMRKVCFWLLLLSLLLLLQQSEQRSSSRRFTAVAAVVAAIDCNFFSLLLYLTFFQRRTLGPFLTEN